MCRARKAGGQSESAAGPYLETMSYAASQPRHGRETLFRGLADTEARVRVMGIDLERERVRRHLSAVAHGDAGALRELYRATSGKLFGVCLKMLRDEGEAEEVLQEVYLTVWKRAGSYDAAKASPITWLAAIARNRAIDRLRASGARVISRSGPLEEAMEIADAAPDSETQTLRGEEARRLGRCLDGLDPHQADLIRRAFFGGLSYSDLAQAAGRPLGTVKTWIRKGLMNLKVCLES